VVNFDDQQKLLRTANNQYSTDQQHNLVVEPNVQQGFLEQSNVQAVKELVGMITAQRTYQKLSRTIDTEFDRQRRAVQQLGPTGN
ncbi:MAG: flagellar basal body rod C-terminal domain-containing protein, partial [Pseudomonadota bacterium]